MSVCVQNKMAAKETKKNMQQIDAAKDALKGMNVKI